MYATDYDDLSVTQFRKAGGWLYLFAGSGKALGFMDPIEGQNWNRETLPDTKDLQIFINPGAPNNPDPNYGFINTSGAGNGSYAANGNLLGLSQTAFSDPASTIWLQDKATTTRESIDSLDKEAEVLLKVAGMKTAMQIDGEIVTGSDPKVANNFDQQARVVASNYNEVCFSHGDAVVTLPPLSFFAGTFELAV